ncbi:uncharacterized protein LOC130751429 [Actinidia eriantha]|uniref:uncharacterized protein LOC130751429 n=1 Tax=Actinidia eriantha TaxID=165200 RepID=UPI002584CB73|nr:uncharacterized protein LOC130751429 [Actinidia eriantha]XP_057461040.1 uncharacterized protein LOC130751429 [Actinidia eriantha]
MPMALVGGLWVGWKPSITAAHFNFKWRLALIYGIPKLQDRALVWQSIEAILKADQVPLRCVGDFNRVYLPSDKIGWSSDRMPGAFRFQQFLSSVGLFELSSIVPNFTWTNNRDGKSYTFERLDRCFCNQEWFFLFASIVQNYPIHGSDHAPIALTTSRLFQNRHRLFKFEAYWTSYDDSRHIISKCWSEEVFGSPLFRVAQSLKKSKKALIEWHKNGLGSLASNIIATRSKLSFIQEEFSSPDDFLREANLISELENLLLQ